MRVIFALTILVGCGVTPAVVDASLRVSSALLEDVDTFTLYVMPGQRTDGIVLGCSSLLSGDVGVSDERVLILAETSFRPTEEPPLVSDVPAGNDRVVYVVGADANGTVVADGCADGVAVQVGRETPVIINIFAR